MSDDDQRDDDQDDTSASDESDDSEGTGTDASDTGSSDTDASETDSSAADDSDVASSAPATNPYDDSPSAKAKARAASAGARLAAAKAAKAAVKAAKKQARREEAGVTQSAAERDAEDLAQAQSAEEVLKGSPLGRAATRAGEWTQAHQQLAFGVLGVAIVALLGFLGWSFYTTSQAAAAGALLQDAMEISGAPIVAEGDEAATTSDDDADEDDAPTYATAADRNTAALAAYRRVSSEYPSSQAAAWARLGEGRTLLSQAEYDDARTAYEAAFDHSGDEPVVAWQALEGIGAAYEAQENWAQATSTYERLAALSDHAYESVANYHLARMHAASGDESAALTSFRELVDTLREEGDDGEPPFPYVLAQADQRLRELDPSAAGAGPSLHGAGGGGGGADAEGAGAGSGIDNLSPEQLQELIRRLQSQGAGGAGGAAPTPPE